MSLYDNLVSFGNWCAGLVKSAAIKVGLLIGAYALAAEMGPEIAKLMPTTDTWQHLFDNVPDSCLYFINLLQIPYLFSAMGIAIPAKWAIKKIPGMSG